MASPRDDSDQRTSLDAEACNLPVSECSASGTSESSNSVKESGLFCKSVLGKLFEGGSKDLFKAYPETLHSLDRLCEETRVEGSGLANNFCLEGLAEAQTCFHKEGSFKLSPKAVALCVHISNVICLNSFLFSLRIEHLNRQEDIQSAIEMAGLTDELSRLSDKWKWSGDSCKDTFSDWGSFTSEGEDSEKTEAMKLLYQWTYPSLNPTFARVDCELDKALGLLQSKSFENFSEIECLMKWGDELCKFLEEYKTLFDTGDTEFLYEDIFHFHTHMAQLHKIVGNKERSWELLQTIREMLDRIEDNDLMVTKGGKRIAYLRPDPFDFITKKWIVYRERFQGTDARYMVQNIFLWKPFIRVKDGSQEKGICKWYLDLLQLLDLSCEGSEFEESVLDIELGRVEGLKESLICRHDVERSFDLSPEVVVRCLHVANIISFNCFLFCLRNHLDRPLINAAVVGDELAIKSALFAPNGKFFPIPEKCEKNEKTVLTDELSRLSDKWKWSGDYCKETFKKWSDYMKKASFKEEAMKLLYQWTVLPVAAVLVSVEHEMDDGGYDYAEVLRVSKLGDEICSFLEVYRKLFQPLAYSKGIEFLFDPLYEYYRHTAELHLVLGEKGRAQALLNTVKRMLDDTEKNDLWVPKIGTDKIEYLKPDPVTRSVRKWTILHVLIKSDQESEDQSLYTDDIDKSFRDIFSESRGKDFHKFASEQGLIRSPFDSQLYDIIRLIDQERFSEALEAFQHLDLQENRCNRTNLRRFLEYLNTPWIKFHSCSTSTLKWETFCKRQVLLLDVSKGILGDDQLTAKFFLQYGTTIANHSIGKLLPEERRRLSQEAYVLWNEAPEYEIGQSQAQDASNLKHWLKEELDLQFPSPAPENVKAVISCLRDRCSSDECLYKSENLRPMLKACHLLKCSIDIYSDLLHNWIEEPVRSNEDEWLKLLDSQKVCHNTLLSYLFEMVNFCMRSLLDCNNPSVSFSRYSDADTGSPSLGSTEFDLRYINDDPEWATGTDPSVVTAFLRSILVWAERGRARTLLHQLGPWYDTKHEVGNSGFLREELIEFDKDEQAALHSILSCESACNRPSLFVEYWSETLSGNRAVAFMVQNHSVFSKIFYCSGGEVKELLDDFYKAVKDQYVVSEKVSALPAGRAVELQKLEEKLQKLVQKLHEVLERLYDILIEPISNYAWFKQLNPKATLVFVPDKMLYRVPFALLRDKKTQKYLFQVHPIAIAPSLRLLQHCERRLRKLENSALKPEKCILAVGNATYVKNPLRGTKQELKHLQSCFPGRVRKLTKDDATRANFLEQLVNETSPSQEEHAFAFVHLGVHGNWSEAKPTLKLGPQKTPNSNRTGSLKFAELSGDPKEVLSSEDIVKSGQQWPTRLVILSACNSSRGQAYGDGEVNLPRALMIAGVPAAVVSQWQIGDSASKTPRLMRAFYENLKYGKDVATALQSAMIELSNDPKSESARDNIFDWGPFLVWGLPTVQLPQELWYSRVALAARQRTEFLNTKFGHVEDHSAKAVLMEALNVVDIFLKAAYTSNNPWELPNEDIIGAIYNLEELLRMGFLKLREPDVLSTVMNLAEEVYSVVPPERLRSVELEMENNPEKYPPIFMVFLRQRIMYAQAMKGRHEIALGYADEMIERALCSEHAVCMRQERAVILRMMGKNEEAESEFKNLLAPGEDYECLIQMSYIKHLEGDFKGALKYARRAKKLESPVRFDMPEYRFTLAVKALPTEFCHWLLYHVDESTEASASSSV